jgi:lactoylglutathione lyase
VLINGEEKQMKMLQVTIRTNKFEEELAFYKEIVRLKIVRDLREKGRGIVFLADREGDTCIEIINTPDGDDAGNKLLSIGFGCGDADRMREKLIALGMEVSPIESPVPYVRFFFVKDPAGVTVQFM